MASNGCLVKVLVLGATGNTDRLTCQRLVASDVVTEILAGGRNLERARRTATELGPKATPVQLDASDAGSVATAADADMLVNAAGPDAVVLLPALRGAIQAGAHYCDICVDGRVMEKALELDAEAREAGVTALLGVGAAPGLTNLILLHAARQLDRCDEARIQWFFPVQSWGDPKDVLADLRASGRADASWESLFRSMSGRARVYRGGSWTDVDSSKGGVEVALPTGQGVVAYPTNTTEAITLPRYLPGVKKVSTLACMFPPQLNPLLLEQARRIGAGEASAADAIASFFETILGDPKRWVEEPPGFPPSLILWATAIGTKGGRNAQYMCWPTSNWLPTAGSLALCTLKILRGEIRKRGVFPPEACLDPLQYLAEAATYGPEPPKDGRLLDESLELLP